MSSLDPPTGLERVSGNLGTEAALTLIGAFSGNPLAALLPILSSSLASERHKKRVEAALHEIDATLHKHEEQLRNLSDSQYKILNEVILAVLQTTDQEKISYLRRAVTNSLQIDDLQTQEAVVLGRIIRDISAEEADFLANNFQYDRVQVSTAEAEHEMKVRNVKPDSAEGTVVTGLISLGLLTAAEPTWDESGLLRYSPIVAKLLVLLRA
jgi:hypothetical protein